MVGTIVNTVAVILGSSTGLLLKSRFPERISKSTFDAIGLFTIFLGIISAFKTQNMLILILSVVFGTVIGSYLKLEERMEKVSDYIKNKLKSTNSNFTEGFITAFLLFCTGSLTILGAIEEGINSNPELLFSKSILDGFSSIALASVLGVGVMVSAIPLLIFQGGLTLTAVYLSEYLSEAITAEITASGGIILIGLGLRVANIKKIEILNMLPAIFIAGILAAVI